ncbi:hypothetical protein [uncultured Methanobrevibacter sp.]|uniref:hypothetical protein n=1 Tax=uncultured Methanobrevibacter sp. TaxID=253161 RepID=UPI0025E886E4|nr:hypothetical protein [uncultured Methanobrevibacter sp.]
MKYKRMVIILILLIFSVGMIMGTASASHTFKADGYKYKMSDKKFKAMKKHAKKHGSSLKTVKASKVRFSTSIEKLKVGKTYTLPGGEKVKVLKFIKAYKGTKYGGGGYKYKVKYFARMDCWVDYVNGKYIYSAILD